jgi:hypothetical protein
MKKSSSRRGKAKDGDDTVVESLREDGSFRSDDEGEVDRFASLLNPSDYSADGVRPSHTLLLLFLFPSFLCLRSFVRFFPILNIFIPFLIEEIKIILSNPTFCATGMVDR